MKTLKQIITTFLEVADNHPQVNEAGWGILEDREGMDREYPLVWLETNGGVIDSAAGSNTMDFKMYVVDRVLTDTNESDKSNRLDVTSDTVQIGNDIITMLDRMYDEYGFELIGNVSYDDVEDVDDQSVSGHEFPFSVYIPIVSCIEQIPGQ